MVGTQQPGTPRRLRSGKMLTTPLPPSLEIHVKRSQVVNTLPTAARPPSYGSPFSNWWPRSLFADPRKKKKKKTIRCVRFVRLPFSKVVSKFQRAAKGEVTILWDSYFKPRGLKKPLRSLDVKWAASFGQPQFRGHSKTRDDFSGGR